MPRILRVLTLVSITMLIGAVLIPPASGGAAPRCFGQEATIVGTSGPDVLVGTNRKDVIVGGGGADTISGRDRGDLICAGRGDDVVRGGDGIDLIFGNQGDDRLLGGLGAYNQIVPGPGDDFANGGPQLPNRASDELIYLSASGGVVVDLGAGTATGEGNDEIVNFEWLIGSNHDDVLTGSDR